MSVRKSRMRVWLQLLRFPNLFTKGGFAHGDGSPDGRCDPGFSVGCLCGWMTMGLAILVLAYDFILKKHAILGPVAMGACRGLSLMLGAYAVEKPVGMV